MQIDNVMLDQITQNIMGVVNMVGESRQEMVNKLRDAVRDGVEHFDLVTRDEFDAAQTLLSNTRIKVDVLEKQVAELEAALAKKV
ncbi:MAG: accessory factor UbiK family protein, partial [Magnetococcales bacterium]|nr:accessory factor UbiK family protein [Magnetococcales bacterium]